MLLESNMTPQIKARILFFMFIGMFVMFEFYAAKIGKQAGIEQYREQYSAWTNYSKRMDVSFTDFVQLKDIGVLRQ